MSCQQPTSRRSSPARSMRSAERERNRPFILRIAGREARDLSPTYRGALTTLRSSMKRHVSGAVILSLAVLSVSVLFYPAPALGADTPEAKSTKLPDAYFPLLEAGSQQVEGRLNAGPMPPWRRWRRSPDGRTFRIRSLRLPFSTARRIRRILDITILKCLPSLSASETFSQLRAKRGAMSRGWTATGTPTCGSTPIDCSSLNSARSEKNAGVERSKRLLFPWFPTQ